MADWRDRPEDLCYAGESVVETVEVGGTGGPDGADAARLVVTTHRLLAFAPGAEPRFRQVDRPNVTGVRFEADDWTDLLRAAGRPAAWGLVALVAGSVVSLDSLLVPVESPSGAGLGGVVALVQALVTALSLLDDALRVGGAILLLVAVALAARHLRNRERAVVVGVSGGDDIEFPGDETTVAAIRGALDPE